MRKRALEEVTPISSIYNDTLVDIATNYEDVDVAQKMPTFAVVKSSLYRSRQKRFPRSREHVSLQGEWETTLSGERFLLCDDGDTDNIIMFATYENLNLLLEANTNMDPGIS